MDQEAQPTPYGKHQAPARYEPGDGCLTTLVRIPVRIVVLVFVLPVRMVWDVLVAGARGADRVLLRPLGRGLARLFDVLVATPAVWLYRSVLTPLGHALRWLATALLVWPWVGLWRYVVVPVVRYGIAVPLGWLYAAVLTPLGHGLGWIGRTLLAPAGRGIARALGWVLTALFVWPVVGLWKYVLTPLGHALTWMARNLVALPLMWSYRRLLTPLGHGTVWLLTVLLVVPVVWTYRRILAPVGRELLAAFAMGWRIAGFISRAVGRVLAWLAWNLVGAPMIWAYRRVCTPVGHFVRDHVLAPARRAVLEAGRAARSALGAARETVRQARRDAWRALAGKRRVAQPRELNGSAARRLGGEHHATTDPSAAPAPEISPLTAQAVKRG
ncbi:hypothetical protein F0344_24960 [Streptomyces finlayi]|uniref:Uncharacterized protein n=1 Tax=Streptomyces finlayi TaxID=67296 RepID=A0A7G7BPZ7_9ACTN|nr:hypothetical protein [Streptomyces finlayi]QNE77412.1 hypothetical protein F0344_24960 [Streptomyces finlayi]